MELPNNYLIFAAEVFSTMLGLLIALIYFYIRSARKWQLHIHSIQDELLAYRTKYLEEKERVDAIRELLNSKSSELEKLSAELEGLKKRTATEVAEIQKRASAELAEAKKSVEEHLATIAKLKEEIEELHQSEKLRSEIVNQLVTSKIQNEHLSAELETNKKTISKLEETINNLEHEINVLNNQSHSTEADEQNDYQQHLSAELEAYKKNETALKETISNLEHEINVLNNQAQSNKTNEPSYTLQTKGEMDFNRLKARADKQAETIRNLELELMRVAYKKPPQQTDNTDSEDTVKNQELEQKLNESETCVKLLESELSELQSKIRTLEEELQTYKNGPQGNSDIQQLQQMLKESETCNTLLETELDSLMQKIRILEGKGEPPKPPPHYDI